MGAHCKALIQLNVYKSQTYTTILIKISKQTLKPLLLMPGVYRKLNHFGETEQIETQNELISIDWILSAVFNIHDSIIAGKHYANNENV